MPSNNTRDILWVYHYSLIVREKIKTYSFKLVGIGKGRYSIGYVPIYQIERKKEKRSVEKIRRLGTYISISIYVPIYIYNYISSYS